MNRNSYDYQTLLKTIYSEARGESELGQRAVAWVIYNRAKLNRIKWGGSTLEDVCEQRGLFQNTKPTVHLSVAAVKYVMYKVGTGEDHFQLLDSWLPAVYQGLDPSHGTNSSKKSKPFFSFY